MVGNIPNFNEIDILRCFLYIDTNTSRSYLVKKLELGEGTIRTILDILKDNGLTESTNRGHSLSSKGKKLLNQIRNEIILVEDLEYKDYKNLKNKSIVVKNHSKISKTTSLRDIAIKNGSEAALILVFDKKLTIPDFDCPEDFSSLEKYHDFKQNDVLILTFATSNKIAEQSALSIVANLNEDIQKFIKSLKK